MQGDVVALKGRLGSGKTWFTKGLAIGVGVDRNMVISSPSFALVNEYKGRFTFYHMDLYRLEDLSDVYSIGLEEYLYEDGIVAIEWADKWPEIIPDYGIEVEISIMDDQRRAITIFGHHSRFKKVIQSMEQEVNKD
jgi:tRNA threonylcarbamoyladenosine biosynthesis protein TsaE